MLGSYNWNGADFLAHHMVTGEMLKIQLKGRVTIDKKYIGETCGLCARSVIAASRFRTMICSS